MYQVLIFLIFAAFVTGEEQKTECQQHREREAKSTAPLPMRLIPECDENGDYKPRQCFQESKFCACWNKTGHPVTQPSQKIKACECIVQKEAANSIRRIGSFMPRCEEDGKYQKKQCHSSTGHCWCVEPETGKKVTEPVRGVVQC